MSGLRLLGGSLHDRPSAVAVLAVWSLVEAVPALTAGLLVAQALDRGFLAGRPVTGLAWLGLYALAQLAGVLATRQTYGPLADLVEPLRDDLTRLVVRSHLSRVDQPAHQSDSVAVNRVVDQVETVRTLTATVLRNLRPAALSLIAALIGLAGVDLDILVVVAVPLVLTVAAYCALFPRTAARQRSAIGAGEVLAGTSGRLLDGLREVTAAGAEAEAKARTGIAVDGHAVQLRRLGRSGALRTLVITAGGYLPIVAVLAAAPWLLAGRATTGEVTGAFVYLVSTLQPALQSLAQMTGSWLLQLTVTAGHLARSCAPRGPELRAGDRRRPADGSVRLRGLSFGYGRLSTPTVDDLDFDISAGEHVAVVGPSGAGKSTLVNLIGGLISPQAGDILIGGVPLASIDPVELHRQVVLVPQQAYLFAGTLRENLAYLAPCATDRDLDRAVTALALEPVVRRLGGYAGLLAPHGDGLSAGEAQLIALARVYLVQALVVLLDEATCHLDPAAEARAEQAFAASGSTLVVVAHRAASAARAQRVLVVGGPTG
ncbi:ABC transporter ATP-binding protein [Kribbella albertanoniae]|uniref:ABC transporter ATP-binding protein n=1 Tax=Kribbella albertanoniae TaxID=1266829 RepID=A0A4V2XSI1_9ACTN|nr:ABC transporter ATP-binding protein [Kribbella albertanoniae]TDC33655.1 ABC transporter ATP-binding protein [Kribbella albertanoniae]